MLIKCPFKFDFSKLDVIGPTGYMDQPVVSVIKGYDLLFAGIPCELDKTGLPGASQGYEYARRDMFCYGACDQILDIDMGNSIKGGDVGNIIIDMSSEVAAKESVYYCVKEMISEGATAFTIGGDEATVYGQIKACYEKYGKLSIVHLGATVSDAMIQSIDEGLADGNDCIELGVRSGFSVYGKKLKDKGVKVITSSDIPYHTLEETGKAIADSISGKNVVILYDANFMDPAFTPSASRPYPGGVSEYEAVVIIEEAFKLADVKLCCAYGLRKYNDPGEVSINNFGEVTCKLYAAISYGIASRKEN